jgi:uncharacterized protein YggU (UPF0235/DUF167 family)
VRERSARARDAVDASVRFAVRLTPRAAADRVEGVGAGGELLVRVTAPPVEGAANAALARLLASTLDVPGRAVALVAGGTSRRKLVEVEGIAARELAARWPGLSLGAGRVDGHRLPGR